MNISFFDEKSTINELDFKVPLIEKLAKIDIENMINLLFYGNPTCGKTTQIYAFLATVLNRKVYDLKNMTFEEDRKTINYKASIYHIEIDPVILGSNDKFFIQNFLKMYTETRNIGLNTPKIILIKNAELLSKQSQLMLRKIIETTSITARFIFEVSNISNFTEPLKSRCLIIKIKVPSLENIKICVKNFSKRKGFDLDDQIINEIIEDSNKIYKIYNLKKIFGFLRYYLLTNKRFSLLYYDKFEEILNIITNKKISFVSLQKIRELVNEMYINLVPMHELLDYLFNKLLTIHSKNNEFIDKILELTSICDINLKKGNKECLHLEYYIIAVIDLLHK